MGTEHDATRAHLVRLVVEASDGNFTAQELAQANGSLQAMGYSSLSYIRLIDAVENELGVYIDPDQDIESLDSVDGILALLVETGESARA